MSIKLFRRKKIKFEKIIEENGHEIEQDEREMIRGVFGLGETPVKAIMVPRTDVIALSDDEAFDNIVKIVIGSSHSRIPVYEETIDNVIGFLHAKDLLPYLARKSDAFDIKSILRPVRFVPEGKMIDELLKELQKKKEHIAVVVDEYGGMAGIVCLENILEEIVGEIQDEYDNEEEDIKEITSGSYSCDARTLIPDVNETLGIDLPLNGSDSLGGFVFNLFGKIPAREETISHKNILFTVESMDGHRIRKVKIRVHDGKKKNEKKA